VTLDEDLVAAVRVVEAPEEVVEADLVERRRRGVEMWPPTPMPGRCARCTVIAAFQRIQRRYRRSSSSSPGNSGSFSGAIVLM
jgi:hypothetical protein